MRAIADPAFDAALDRLLLLCETIDMPEAVAVKRRHRVLASPRKGLGRRPARFGQIVECAVLGLAHAGKEIQIGLKVVPLRQKGEAVGALRKQRFRLGRDGKGRRARLPDGNRIVPGLPDLPHCFTSRTARATWC